VLGADLAVKGDITASADLHIDGHIAGDITRAALVQGEASVIEGNATGTDRTAGRHSKGRDRGRPAGRAQIGPDSRGCEIRYAYDQTGAHLGKASEVAVGLDVVGINSADFGELTQYRSLNNFAWATRCW